MTRRDNAMPVEVAQVLYDLAGSLALCRCGSRIIGLSDDRFRKNVAWVLNQPWIDTRLRPVLFEALEEAGACANRRVSVKVAGPCLDRAAACRL